MAVKNRRQEISTEENNWWKLACWCPQEVYIHAFVNLKLVIPST